MVVKKYDIDIKENVLLRKGALLDILLTEHTTKKNIIWATDSYESYGKQFSLKKQIKPELITGLYNKIIQPRAAKSLVEQRQRTKGKAEVFTPLKVVDQINKAVDILPNKNNWQDYLKEIKLEITCGEAPFIVSRYNPTSYTGKLIKINNRVGFLDKKLKVVSRYCDNKKNWLYWAKESFKASYGYDWQGDNVLLARENLLYTFIDYYKNQFGRKPTVKLQEEFAEIISWNIFQMDGLKYVIPMSCHQESNFKHGLFGKKSDIVEKYGCDGCKYNKPYKHNGKYVQIMDWNENEIIRFVDLILSEKNKSLKS